MPGREIIARGRRSEIIAWGPGKVLKLYEQGWSAAAVAGELEATSRAAQLGIPAPRTYGLVELDGRHGIILERLTGPTMLDALLADHSRCAELGSMLAEIHSAVHAHEVPEAPSQRQQLRRRINSTRSPLAAGLKQASIAALEELPDGATVCHGDLHGLNIILSAERGPVIIDWDSPTAGNPVADVGRTLLIVVSSPRHVPPRDRELVRKLASRMARAYLCRYFELRPASRSGRRDLRTWLWINAAARLVEGIADEEAWLINMVRTGAAARMALP